MHRVEKERARSSRSRPVSCHFCRLRKLKCSRLFPCTNCTSRGKTCQLYPTPQLSVSPPTQVGELPNIDSADVLARLRRLEEIVIGNGPSSNFLERGNPQAASLPSSPAQKNRDSNQPYMLHEGQSSAAAVTWLEGEITAPGSSKDLLGYELEFRACPIRSALQSAPGVAPNPSTKKCIWLPLHEEAKTVTEKYITEITFLHHVVHVPSVRTMVDELYHDLSENKSVKLGHVSLLLGILASTTTLWTELDMHSSVFSTVEEANAQSTHWMNVAMEVLEHSRYKHLESIEDVQALVILIFVTTNLVGIASQARHIISTAISVARELCLHRIDHPYNSNLDVPSPSSAKAEICRRVWWYLVATDWQISQLSGSQKGTYSIDPRHMMTNKPANADDEDIIDGKGDYDKPPTHPTSMSYCLQRVRLAELCREITDSAPLGISDPETPDYERAKQIDRKICEFAASLPSFFSLNYSSAELPQPNSWKSAGLIVQRYIINFLLYAQRCRLHLPYLSRALKDPVYDYSRSACLEAARMVVQTESQISLERIPLVLARLKFSGILQCVCVAIIVLLVEFCGSSSEQEQGRVGRAELLQAFGILEKAKGQSPFAERLLESFKSVLRRHNASDSAIHWNTITQTDQEDPTSAEAGCSSTTATTMVGWAGGCTSNLPMDPTQPGLDDLWQVFDDTVDSGTVDWNTLFAELDPPFLSM